MRRYRVGRLVTLALTVLVAALVAAAPKPAQVSRIGVLLPGVAPAAPDGPPRSPLQQGLRDLGWVAGQTLVIEYRWAEGHLEQLPALAADLVHLPVDVIVAGGNAAIAAAQQATRTIPIVMFDGNDPVGAQFIASLARPGGNITGTVDAGPAMAGKLLEVLTEAVPQARRVAVLYNPTHPGIRDYEQASLTAERALGVTLQPVEVRQPSDIAPAFESLRRERPDALYVVGNPVVALHRQAIVDFAARHRVPAIYTGRPFVDAGGLMSYGPSLREMAYRTAVFIDKILKGAQPADLPVEQPTKFELVINLKTAQALGITLPPHLLVLADEVIK
jgi:putative tryptophan/tyrosine transport system substrate-binding protein